MSLQPRHALHLHNQAGSGVALHQSPRKPRGDRGRCEKRVQDTARPVATLQGASRTILDRRLCRPSRCAALIFPARSVYAARHEMSLDTQGANAQASTHPPAQQGDAAAHLVTRTLSRGILSVRICS